VVEGEDGKPFSGTQWGWGHLRETLGLHGTQLVNIHSNLKEEVGVTKHWTCGPQMGFASLLYLCLSDPP